MVMKVKEMADSDDGEENGDEGEGDDIMVMEVEKLMVVKLKKMTKMVKVKVMSLMKVKKMMMAVK